MSFRVCLDTFAQCSSQALPTWRQLYQGDCLAAAPVHQGVPPGCFFSVSSSLEQRKRRTCARDTPDHLSLTGVQDASSPKDDIVKCCLCHTVFDNMTQNEITVYTDDYFSLYLNLQPGRHDFLLQNLNLLEHTDIHPHGLLLNAPILDDLLADLLLLQFGYQCHQRNMQKQ